MEKEKFDVFISYRREGGEVMGRLVYELLKCDYDPFFDHESLSSGEFNDKIFNIIENCTDVLFVLSPNCFDRCCEENDFFLREIECAIKNKKQIMNTEYNV